jgi:hypothetical protein
MGACLEKREANPEETEATVETIGALEDRYGDQQPLTRYQNPLKRRTQDDDV